MRSFESFFFCLSFSFLTAFMSKLKKKVLLKFDYSYSGGRRSSSGLMIENATNPYVTEIFKERLPCYYTIWKACSYFCTNRHYQVNVNWFSHILQLQSIAFKKKNKIPMEWFITQHKKLSVMQKVYIYNISSCIYFIVFFLYIKQMPNNSVCHYFTRRYTKCWH